MTGFGGTLGRYALQGTNLAYEGATGTPRAESGPEDFFLSRGFVRDVTRGSTSQQEFWKQASKDGGQMIRAEGTFRAFMKDGNDAAAQDYLGRLSAKDRAYVLASVFSFDGSSKFHPMVRARETLSVIGDLRRELRNNEARDLRGQPVQLTSTQMRQADDALAGLAMAEMRNALIGADVNGWGQKARIDPDNYRERVAATSPQVSLLLQQRLLLANVPDERQASQAWSVFGPRLEDAARQPNILQLLMRERRMRTTEGKVREIGYANRGIGR